MKVNTDKSRYREHPLATTEFALDELKRLRFLLRRLRFLDAKAAVEGGVHESGTGAVFADLEIDALVYVLSEIGYLEDVA